MHNINITNLSDHDQEFEAHGWNNNSNMTVQAHTTAVIQAEDGSSGAIIALYDGHEGEQAEITKNGFGGNNLPISLPMVPALTTCPYQGNDFFDLSNIVGAGGNMTVQQVDKPATRKGDPRFMQNLNDAWHRADGLERLWASVYISMMPEMSRESMLSKTTQSSKISSAPSQMARPISALTLGEAAQTMQTTTTNHPPDKATRIYRSPTTMVTPHPPR